MEILIFAAITGFILFRLCSVLGKDVGFKPGLQEPTTVSDAPMRQKEPTATVANQISDLQELDPSFDAYHFTQGATQAFAMILDALNKGDKSSLKDLLTPQPYKVFEKVIITREKNGEVWDNHLLRVQSADIQDISVENDNQVYITLKVVSEQILMTSNAKGEVIDGDANQIEIISDLWTFTRKANDADPNWLLAKTAEVE